MRHFNDRREPRGKPSEQKPAARISRQKRLRMTKDEEYNATSDMFKEENPYCYNCHRHYESSTLHTDHIVRGNAGRPASLLNFDTWINQCPACHDLSQPIEDKIVMKLVNVVLVIERLRGRRLSNEQCEKICDDFVNAMAD